MSYYIIDTLKGLKENIHPYYYFYFDLIITQIEQIIKTYYLYKLCKYSQKGFKTTCKKPKH